MSDYRVISSDNHVVEPADLWISRIESKFKDRAPHIEYIEGGDWWVCDGQKVIDVAGSGALAGVRFEEPEKLNRQASIEDVRPGGTFPRSTSKTWTSTAST